MKLTYVGRHRGGVQVNDQKVGYGETVEVDDAVAASLLTQAGQWEAAKAAPAKAAPKTPNPADEANHQED